MANLNDTEVKAVRAVVDEIINSLVRESGEKEYRKDAIKGLEDKYGLEKKILNKIIKDRYNDKFNETVGAYQEYIDTYETIFKD